MIEPQPYPAYKYSGVQSLGDVPEHWAVRRQRNVVEVRVSNIDKHTTDGETPVRICNYVDVYKNERITSRIGFMRASASPDEIKRFQLEKNDVIITKDSEAWNDIGVPALVNYAAPDLVCGYHLAILRPRRGAIRGEYLFRALQSKGVASQFHISANGVTRYGLSHNAIKSIVVPIPSDLEQAAIVRFLDHMDRRIRRYIRAKHELIRLLREERQAIVHRAVTRGLDPSARLKPSGIDWIGEIPEHWDIVRVKHVARMESGHTPSRSNPDHWLDTNDIPWVSLNDTKALDRQDYISDTALHINELGLQNSSARLLPTGVVVFTRDATVGKTAITTRPMAVSQHLIAWVCGPKISNEYLLRVFYAMKNELSRFTFGATIATIGMDDVRKVVMPLPSMHEQKAIAIYLGRTCQGIDKALTQVQEQLRTVQEYRTRLIADVVTGKLDVRGAAAKLPDEPEEPVAADLAEVLEGEEAEEALVAVEAEAGV